MGIKKQFIIIKIIKFIIIRLIIIIIMEKSLILKALKKKKKKKKKKRNMIFMIIGTIVAAVVTDLDQLLQSWGFEVQETVREVRGVKIVLKVRQVLRVPNHQKPHLQNQRPGGGLN